MGTGAARYHQVSCAEVRKLLPRGAQLVDVMPPEDYAPLHLPGAINIPLKRLDAQTTSLLDRSRAVIVYCWDSL